MKSFIYTSAIEIFEVEPQLNINKGMNTIS